MSWPLVKLTEVAEVNPRCPKDIDEDQLVSFVAMASASEEGVLLGEEPKILKDTKKGFTYFERGDVLLAKITPCFENGKSLRPYQIKHQVGFGSTEFHVVRADLEKLDPTYLFYLLWSDAFRFLGTNAMAGAAGQKRVGTPFLKQLEIPLPPLEEQKRIAAILDKADAILQKRKQAIDLADEFLRSVFLDMFGDPVTNPKGWEIKTVKECLEAKIILDVQDGNHGNSHPKVSDFSSEGIPFLAANVIRKGKVLFDSCYYLSSEWLDKLRIGFAKPRDVLLSHKGTLGLTAVLDSTYDDYIFSPQTTYYRLDERTLMPEYLKGYFDTQSFQTLLEKEGKQSTRAYIGITRQKELPIMLPPMEEQLKFVKLVSSYNQWYAKLNSTDVFLNESFNSLSQKAFSGQL